MTYFSVCAQVSRTQSDRSASFFRSQMPQKPASSDACLLGSSVPAGIPRLRGRREAPNKKGGQLFDRLCQSLRQCECCVACSGDVFPASYALRLLVHLQVLSALSNAALDDAFASAVLGKKVSRGKHVAVEGCCSSSIPVSIAGWCYTRESLCHCGVDCPGTAAAAIR